MRFPNVAALSTVLALSSFAHARGGKDAVVTRVDGVYTAPTRADLADVAANPVKDVKWKLEDGEATLSYDLPAELVGDTSTEISMTGPLDRATGSYTMTGALGTATCTPTLQADGGTSMHCVEVMPELNVDLVATEAALAARVADPVERARRLEVAVGFAHEPIGFVDFEIPNSLPRNNRPTR
ncbi:MAG: hypothetical protein U0169_11610 [Polyangiaceae bacterium]